MKYTAELVTEILVDEIIAAEIGGDVVDGKCHKEMGLDTCFSIVLRDEDDKVKDRKFIILVMEVPCNTEIS